jgi:glycosyltransferase involved in cell wall biosynthesis
VVSRVVFAVPGALTIPTGGYAYDGRIIAELRAREWDVDVLDLGDGFPRPSAQARAAAHARLAALPRKDPIVIDGLAFGVLPDAATKLAASHRLLALVHHPLALEAGLSPAEAEALRACERRALAAASGVVVTSAFTARLVISDYGVPPHQVRIVRPGTDRVPPGRGSGEQTVSLLAVGAIVPRKGYHVLLAALASLRARPWRLTIVGDRSRDAGTAARLDADLARFNLTERVRFAGAVSAQQMAALYASADLFVLASRFEGYGMAFAEAIAHGVPVIGTTAGAIPETVPANSGILVPPDDSAALASALRQLIDDPARRQRLAASARAAATELPTWPQAGDLFAQAIAAMMTEAHA